MKYTQRKASKDILLGGENRKTMKERQKISAGDKVEHIDPAKNETLTVISTDVLMCNASGRSVEAIIYASNKDGIGKTWKVMRKDEFYSKYKVFGEEIEEEEE